MSTDTILGIFGIAVGVVGIIAAYIFYIKGKREKEPCWSIYSVNLIKGYKSLFKDLSIKYKRKSIENLTISKIVFWNNGNETIDKNDIKTSFPPMIFAVDDAEILDAKILQITNAANSFSVTLAENRKFALIDFDYLDYQQGAVIQVVHTGVSKAGIVLSGEIKGAKEILYRVAGQTSHRIMNREETYAWYLVFWIVVFLSYLSVKDRFDSYVATYPVAKFVIWIGLGGIAVLMAGFILFDLFFVVRTTARIPKKLSIFEEDDLGVESSNKKA